MTTAPADPGPDELAELAQLAERVARAAGDLVRDERPAALGVAGTKSSPTDVVTAMDLAAEELITRLLRRARPDDALLGEEGGLVPGTSGLTWVVDPIDGTVNYLYGIPAYAVSVAVVAGDPVPERWRPLAGCVHAPEQLRAGAAGAPNPPGRTWTAAAGAGARLDGELLAPLAPVPLAQALVGTGFGYSAARRAEQGAVVAGLLPLVRDVRRIGSAALDLCAVASGGLDAYYEQGLKPWDVAAGWLVVTEAGGAVTGLDGAAAGERMLVAAAPDLAAELAREVSLLRAG